MPPRRQVSMPDRHSEGRGIAPAAANSTEYVELLSSDWPFGAFETGTESTNRAVLHKWLFVPARNWEEYAVNRMCTREQVLFGWEIEPTQWVCMSEAAVFYSPASHDWALLQGQRPRRHWFSSGRTIPASSDDVSQSGDWANLLQPISIDASQRGRSARLQTSQVRSRRLFSRQRRQRAFQAGSTARCNRHGFELRWTCSAARPGRRRCFPIARWSKLIEILILNESRFTLNNRLHYPPESGHLAARGDFIYATEQRSTFHYINVAPQVSWAPEMEKFLRTRTLINEKVFVA